MRLAPAAMFILLAGWTTISAQSLGCNYGLSPCEAYAQADAIFTGTVIRIAPETISIELKERDCSGAMILLERGE